MKKYVRLACTTCNRSIDRLIDVQRFTPDKCTISFKCEGRLVPVEYRSNAAETAPPVSGVVDWRPRGAQTSVASQIKPESLVDTATGQYQQVVVALQQTTPPPPGSTLTLVLSERNDTPKSFKQFVFRKEGTFTSVSGVESGLEKKTLRYETTDLVEVYVNGVKLEQGSAPENFSIYNGTTSSAVPPNTISFNQAIASIGTSQVDVVVSQTAPITQVQLTFNRNVDDESRLSSGAWENVDSISIFSNGSWSTHYLFTLDLAAASSLNLNTILSVSGVGLLNGTVPVSPTNISFLLARKPYSQIDRYVNMGIPAATLSVDRDYFKYVAVDGKAALLVTDTAVKTFFPNFKVNKFNPEKVIKTSLAGVSSQVVIDGSVIVGPDA